ncbi:MAG: hypothetical protein QW112_00905 [Candidatus Micrarchaeia archaeon]
MTEKKEGLAKSGIASGSKSAPDRGLIIFIGIFVIAMAGIVAFALLYSRASPRPSAESISPASEGQPMGIQKCLARYGLDSTQVFFIYSDTCSFSQKMKPWVTLLESSGYRFVWANIDDASAIQLVSSCLTGIVRFAGTPEFVCPANGKSASGAFGSISDLENFVKECR